jgi:hypothetical protein
MEKLVNITRLIFGFFPVRLVFIHFKRNLLFLIFWIILFGLTSKNILAKYGIDYLFLTPEYLGQISFLSYAILGFSIGGFIMAFNIYSYILVAPRFLFIASLSRPFYKFCLNNFIIPVAYLVFFSVLSIKTQQEHEYKHIGEALFNLLGFFSGLGIFLFLSFVFFFKVNKSPELNDKQRRGRKPVKTTFQNSNSKWYIRALLSNREKVEWYISSLTEVARARDVSHYSKEQLKQILYRNHLNATIFELAVIISLIVLSLFGSNELLFIPAAASLMLMLTFLLMVVSAFYSWIGGWTIPLTIGLIMAFNAFTERSEFLDYGSRITGLEYGDNSHLKNGASVPSTVILNNWKEKQTTDKPKLLVMAVSGGGLRAAMWTVNVLEQIKENLDDLSSLHLVSGSSGGMIGAAYFREEEFVKQTTISKNKKLSIVSKDALNSLAYYLAVNDWLVRFRINERTQRKERGYIFEKQLEENFNGLDKTVGYYKALEQNADIPLMLFAPTIVSTNEQFILSASHNSFFSNPQYFDANQLKGIDSVKLSSVLRMNATFPYIMPVVTSPQPERLNIMDAGLIDNFGIKVLSDYLIENQKWINENTSGVIIIKVVDNEYGTTSTSYSPLKKLTLPLKFSYANFNLQNKNNERLIYQLHHEIDTLDVIEFNLGQSGEPLSLSWHLTKKEKDYISNAMNYEANKNAIRMLKSLLYPTSSSLTKP